MYERYWSEHKFKSKVSYAVFFDIVISRFYGESHHLHPNFGDKDFAQNALANILLNAFSNPEIERLLKEAISDFKIHELSVESDRRSYHFDEEE